MQLAPELSWLFRDSQPNIETANRDDQDRAGKDRGVLNAFHRRRKATQRLRNYEAGSPWQSELE